MPTWNPFVQQGALLSYKAPTPTTFGRLKGYVEIALPWPIPNVSAMFSARLFDLLDSDGSLVVALGSEAEDENAGDYGTDQRRRNGDLPPPTAPGDCPRLWLRALAKAVPLRVSGMSGGGMNDDETRFEVIARVKFPIAHTPQWVIRFVIRTMAPLILAKVRCLWFCGFMVLRFYGLMVFGVWCMVYGYGVWCMLYGLPQPRPRPSPYLYPHQVRELLPKLMDPDNVDSEYPARMEAEPALYDALLTRRVRSTLARQIARQAGR